MSKIIHPIIISGYGMYLPPKIETSEELAKKINKSTEYINISLNTINLLNLLNFTLYVHSCMIK